METDTHVEEQESPKVWKVNQREERKSRRRPESLKRRVQTAITQAGKDPVQQAQLLARFGAGIHSAIRELFCEGSIKRRKTYGRGRPMEYVALGVEWPTSNITVEDRYQAELAANKARHLANRKAVLAEARKEPNALTQTQLNAARNSHATNLEAYEPWPFYDVKFLPYVKFMDAKMKRRYIKTAEFYRHELPKDVAECTSR